VNSDVRGVSGAVSVSYKTSTVLLLSDICLADERGKKNLRGREKDPLPYEKWIFRSKSAHVFVRNILLDYVFIYSMVTSNAFSIYNISINLQT
jgi:hypothetical protein